MTKYWGTISDTSYVVIYEAQVNPFHMQGKSHYPLESRYMENILPKKLCFQTQYSSIIAQVPVICQTQASFQLYRWQKSFCDILLTTLGKAHQDCKAFPSMNIFFKK